MKLKSLIFLICSVLSTTALLRAQTKTIELSQYKILPGKGLASMIFCTRANRANVRSLL